MFITTTTTTTTIKINNNATYEAQVLLTKQKQEIQRRTCIMLRLRFNVELRESAFCLHVYSVQVFRTVHPPLYLFKSLTFRTVTECSSLQNLILFFCLFVCVFLAVETSWQQQTMNRVKVGLFSSKVACHLFSLLVLFSLLMYLSVCVCVCVHTCTCACTCMCCVCVGLLQGRTNSAPWGWVSL